jgi:hypothetical protein
MRAELAVAAGWHEAPFVTTMPLRAEAAGISRPAGGNRWRVIAVGTCHVRGVEVAR